MATIKSYTDLEQSKKLAKILPIESADMQYISLRHKDDTIEWIPRLGIPSKYDIPCWSLAALLAFLPNSAFLERGNVTELYRIALPIELIPFDWFVEPVDACYELILKLHELKML